MSATAIHHLEVQLARLGVQAALRTSSKVAVPDRGVVAVFDRLCMAIIGRTRFDITNMFCQKFIASSYNCTCVLRPKRRWTRFLKRK